MARRLGGLLAVGVVLLFAYALWLRTTSLEALPEVNGDEVWHAIQLTRFLRGEPYSLLTASRLPLSPVHLSFELPFLLIFPPTLWVVRLPALISELLAILLTYRLGSRMLGPRTALIASGFLAVMPIAIIFSRISYECSHNPLYGILILYLAYRLKVWGVSLMLLASYFVHPTNIFLFPLLVTVVCARSYQQAVEAGVALDRRRLAARLGGMTAALLCVGGLAMLSPDTKRLSQAFDTGLWGRHHLLEFFGNYELLLLGQHAHRSLAASVAFWSGFVGLIVLGTRKLVARRQWDRVALVVGLILSAGAIFVMGGSNMIGPSLSRYGFYLVLPTCLAFASLIDALLVPREEAAPRYQRLRWAQYASVLSVGWVVILGVDLTQMSKWSFMAADVRNDKESPWTFNSDARPPLRQLYSLMLRDQSARPSPFPGLRDDFNGTKLDGKTRVVADGWWEYGPLEWLATRTPEIRLDNFDLMPPDVETRVSNVRHALLEGGYVVTFVARPSLDELVRSIFPESNYAKWEIPQADGRPYLRLYRLRWDALAALNQGEGAREPTQVARRKIEPGNDEIKAR